MQVLITGANRGIGLAIATDLLKKGNKVIFACRSQEKGEAAIAALVEEGIPAENACVIAFDANDPDSLVACANAVGEQFPDGIDVVINNAAIFPPPDPLSKIWRINVVTPYEFTDLLVPHLRADGPKRIINTSSVMTKMFGGSWAPETRARFYNSQSLEDITTLLGEFETKFLLAGAAEDEAAQNAAVEGWGAFNAFMQPYTVTKWALTMLTRQLHQKYSGDGVTVVCACPGWCDTDMGRGAGQPPRTAVQGSLVFVWLSEGATVEEHGGKFFHQEESDEFGQIVLEDACGDN